MTAGASGTVRRRLISQPPAAPMTMPAMAAEGDERECVACGDAVVVGAGAAGVVAVVVVVVPVVVPDVLPTAAAPSASAPPTTTAPDIPRCRAQAYGKMPALSNV